MGDGHDKWTAITPLIDDAVAEYHVGRVILLGDLVNDWYATPAMEIAQIEALHDWLVRRDADITVETLIGNHDVFYLLNGRVPESSARLVRGASPGALPEAYDAVHRLLTTLPRPMAISATLRVAGVDWLLTHAGVTSRWWRSTGMAGADATRPTALGVDVALHRLHTRRHAWDALYSAGPARGGDGIPGPLWADRTELLADPLDGVSQMVGHTPVRTVTCSGRGACRLVFADTLSSTSSGRPIGDWSALLADDDGLSAVSLYDPSNLWNIC